MRGLILRFDVAAVPTSLEPSKPTALGRSRQNPRLVTRDGDPPYYEQEAPGPYHRFNYPMRVRRALFQAHLS